MKSNSASFSIKAWYRNHNKILRFHFIHLRFREKYSLGLGLDLCLCLWDWLLGKSLRLYLHWRPGRASTQFSANLLCRLERISNSQHKIISGIVIASNRWLLLGFSSVVHKEDFGSTVWFRKWTQTFPTGGHRGLLYRRTQGLLLHCFLLTQQVT